MKRTKRVRHDTRGDINCQTCGSKVAVHDLGLVICLAEKEIKRFKGSDFSKAVFVDELIEVIQTNFEHSYSKELFSSALRRAVANNVAEREANSSGETKTSQ